MNTETKTKYKRYDDSFKAFVPDQLSVLPELRAKAMFGAHGLYSGERFFGILDEGWLFFQTDAGQQTDHTACIIGPFTHEAKNKTFTMRITRFPPDILENAAEPTARSFRAPASRRLI